MKNVYTNIFDRLGLPTIVVESDNGYIGGEYCHEFVVESDIGESKFFVNESGDYAAHEDVAVFQKEIKNAGEELKPLTPVEAVRGTTMEDGVALHGLPLWQQIKDVLFVDEQGRFILAIIRGDFDVNETKLNHVAGTRELRPATDEEIREQLHSEPGFISPVGIKEKIKAGVELLIVADDSLRTVVNSYGGNNALHQDLFNMNIDRDYQPDIEGDIALAQAGYSAVGGGTLLEKRGIEVGNIFQLGYHYTKLMQGAVFNDAEGKDQPFYMGCYGIGVGRTLAAIVERHHDDQGIIWPEAVAPFQVQLTALNGVETEADALYAQLTQAGVTVLYDDRDKQAGEKFADADLIGLPWRIVVSKKTIAQQSVEIKRRDESEARLVELDAVVDEIK